jgi:HK97 family phage prohead protease
MATADFRIGTAPSKLPLRRAAPSGAAPAVAGNGRIIRYVLSDTSVGRDGHTIAADGWVLDNYLKNPVVLWAHDSAEPPIGRMVEIGSVGQRLMGSVEYSEPDTYPFADTIYRLVKGGYLNATSVAFRALEWSYSQDRARPEGINFKRVELLEVSQVPVPALPTALVAARAAGIDTGAIYDWAERALDGGEPIMVPRVELELLRKSAKMSVSRLMPRVQPATRGFASLAENLTAIARFERDGILDTRLVRAPSGSSEGDPTAGGFLVEEKFARELVAFAYEQSEIAARCDRRPTDFPLAAVHLPAIDETSRADGSRWGGGLA